MTGKPMSWTIAGILFLTMLVLTFALDMAFSSSLRHQLLAFGSDFWRIAVPGDLVADAILVVGMRTVYNRQMARGNRADLKTHPTR
jgi:hypothetical protein